MSEENENKMEAIKKERFAVNMQTMDVAKLNTTEVYTIQRCWERLDVLLDTVYGTAKHYKDWTGGSNQYVKIDADLITGITKIIS